MRFTIRRGRDIHLPGAPAQVVRNANRVSSVALTGSDFPGLQPLLSVEAGDNIAIGQTLFVDRKRPRIEFVSPVCGRIKKVVRGRRRTLDSVVIEADGDESKSFDRPQKPDRESIRALFLASGTWPAFRARPFDSIPEPDSTPHAIFVTAIDTSPLAADPAVVLTSMNEFFQAGLDAIRHLTSGPVFVCQAPGAPLAKPDDQLQIAEFSGPHPAGLPGTHIHHLMPAGRDRSVWHIGYEDVIAVGHLCATGQVWGERIIALAGPAVREPRLVHTHLGADLGEVVAGALHEGDVTLLSGSVVSGRKSPYLGRYHTQVTALGRDSSKRAWSPRSRLAKFFGQGRPKPIIPVGIYDRVMPIDTLVVPLLRALAVGDSRTAEDLGCLELGEDDMALLTYFCPAKLDYGLLLRRTLDEIKKEM